MVLNTKIHSFHYMSDLWNKLEVSTQLLDLVDFKNQLKKELKPPKYKHFSKGSKLGNSLLTRVRLERSNLNLHRFNIGQSDSPECSCHAKHESSIHYLIDCFLYAGERQILFNLVEYYIPSFKTMNRNKKYKVLVMGIDPENPEITQTISIAVKNSFLKQKDFLNNLPLFYAPYSCQI